MKKMDVLNNENKNQIQRDEIKSLKSFNEDSIEPMIKTSREDNDFFVIKIGKKIIEKISKIDQDVLQQEDF